MSSHQLILGHVPTPIVAAVAGLIAVGVLYQDYSKTTWEVFSVFVAAFLVVWPAGLACRELYEMRSETLEFGDKSTVEDN